jgi:1-deoxy-D-xylulose-5-phosphate synthase
LAAEGKKPVVAIYSTFLQRAFDQIVHDVCLQNLNVSFCLDRAGLVGEDGPTHHGCLDLGYLCQLPNMVVMAPKDENEFRHMLKTMVEYNEGPIAIRYPRAGGVGVQRDEILTPIPIGEAELLRDGGDVGMVAIGSMVSPAMEAAEKLAEFGVEAAVLNARFAKPLDRRALVRLARKTDLLVTLEENALAGGFGSATSMLLHGEGLKDLDLVSIGLADRHAPHDSRAKLLKQAGLDAAGIVDFITERLRERGWSPESEESERSLPRTSKAG